MSRAGTSRDLFLPWAGLVFGFLGWWAAHQFGYAATFDACENAAPIPVIVISLLCVAGEAAGAWLSWGILRGTRQGPARKVVATVSVGTAALFALATILPIIAALILPPCFQ